MEFYTSDGEHYINEKGYYCYRRRKDGHGGNAEEHRREMAQIAE